ncbi:MAG: hypothetical protein GKR91_05030 [Pseudomonadales bacterium]|nr:hypothetical protein [Pseudomonadales bacterium]
MPTSHNNSGQEIAAQYDLSLSEKSNALLECIEAQPGATAKPMTPPRATVPNVLMYKVMNKMFAIMSIRGAEGVIVKCDPDQAQFLRDQYEGIGRRSHLDPRFWISIGLDSDVPTEEVHRLVEHSYELVCSKLTRKQKFELSNL